MNITPQKANEIVTQIKKICTDNNLWHTVEAENKPDLKIIRIKEISIKINN